MAALVANNFEGLHNYLHSKFIALELTEKQFENELKESNAFELSDETSQKAKDIYYLLTKSGTHGLNRELLLKYDLFEKKLRLLDLFHNFDTDRDHTLSKEEFIQALNKMGFIKEEIDSMFGNFDTNQDEKISLQEFVQAFEKFLMGPHLMTTQDSTIIESIPTSSKRVLSQVAISLENVKFEANRDDINSFVSRIGKDIKIDDNKSNEVISQLTEYITSYENDISKYEKLYNDLDEQYTEMEGEFWHMKESITKLKSENEIRKSVVLEQKHHLKQLTETSNIPSFVPDATLIDNKIYDQTEQQIQALTQQLESLENEISLKQSQLTDSNGKIKKIASLELANTNLVAAMHKSQELLNKQLLAKDAGLQEQGNILDTQVAMINQLTDEIVELETHIGYLGESLGKDNNDIETLKFELSETQKLIANAKLGRQQSSKELLFRYANMQSERTPGIGMDTGSTYFTSLKTALNMDSNSLTSLNGDSLLNGDTFNQNTLNADASMLGMEKQATQENRLQNDISRLQREKINLLTQNKQYDNEIIQFKEKIEYLQISLEKEKEKNNNISSGQRASIEPDSDHEEKFEEKTPLIDRNSKNDRKRVHSISSVEEDVTVEKLGGGGSCVIFGYKLF